MRRQGLAGLQPLAWLVVGIPQQLQVATMRQVVNTIRLPATCLVPTTTTLVTHRGIPGSAILGKTCPNPSLTLAQTRLHPSTHTTLPTQTTGLQSPTTTRTVTRRMLRETTAPYRVFLLLRCLHTTACQCPKSQSDLQIPRHLRISSRQWTV